MSDHDHYLEIVERLSSIDRRLAAIEDRLERQGFEAEMDEVAERAAQDAINESAVAPPPS
ncbi:MAG: hypothetical protein H0U42_03750 [Thermoleophilaceae bacterium]|nr:hypothetical protein [Thermoleophilaceae bacterium]